MIVDARSDELIVWRTGAGLSRDHARLSRDPRPDANRQRHIDLGRDPTQPNERQSKRCGLVAKRTPSHCIQSCLELTESTCRTVRSEAVPALRGGKRKEGGPQRLRAFMRTCITWSGWVEVWSYSVELEVEGRVTMLSANQDLLPATPAMLGHYLCLIWIPRSRFIRSNHQSSFTRRVREMCLMDGLRPLKIILITTSLSSNAMKRCLLAGDQCVWRNIINKYCLTTLLESLIHLTDGA